MAATREKIDFSDTQLAFQHLSDKALKRRYWLFKKIDSPFLTKVMPPVITFMLKIGLPIKGIIKKTIFNIFCGGTSLENTSGRSDFLNESGVKTILDYSVEGEKNEHGFEETKKEIIRTIRHGAGNDAVAFSAMKVTGIANFDLLAAAQAGKTLNEEQQKRLAAGKSRLDEICKVAHELQQPVFIDAEESWIQDTIDGWAEEMMAAYNQEVPVVYTTTQMYRHDRLAYLKGLVEKAKTGGFIAGVKIVRGAYLEKERERAKEMGYKDPIQPNKASTDRDFDAALAHCVENIAHVGICAGTHNEKSSLLLTELMAQNGVANDHRHVIFAQLLGMSDNISFNLAHHGYVASKYLPYGPVKAVLPYLFRRANENTSVAGQASREVDLLRREVMRRRKNA